MSATIRLTKDQARHILDEVKLGRVENLTWEMFDAAISRIYGDDAPFDQSRMIYYPDPALATSSFRAE